MMMQKIVNWTPRQYRWMKALASSRDKHFGVVLLWLYSWWCRKSSVRLLVNTNGQRHWIRLETNLQ